MNFQLPVRLGDFGSKYCMGSMSGGAGYINFGEFGERGYENHIENFFFIKH